MGELPGGPMSRRVVLVTGGTGGIGKATALGLARLGARVSIVGRDLRRTEAAADEIRTAGRRRVGVFVADLSSLSQVRRLADEVLQRLPRLDVLVNSAGGYWNTRHVTTDGLEQTLALNHLAPFLLTNLLLDRLTESAPARVVTVSSRAPASGTIDFDDLQSERAYSGVGAYRQSKLATILFTYELARRLPDTSVTANAVRPGQGTVQRLLRPMTTKPNASIQVASALELERVTGHFFDNAKPGRSAAIRDEEAAAARLWQVSADLVGLPAAVPPS